jgi:hypothetical protein
MEAHLDLAGDDRFHILELRDFGFSDLDLVELQGSMRQIIQSIETSRILSRKRLTSVLIESIAKTSASVIFGLNSLLKTSMLSIRISTNVN